MNHAEPMALDMPERKGLADIPAEIADEIITCLPVDEARSLYLAVCKSHPHSIVAQSCLRRTSIRRHIGRSLGFENVDRIIASMSRNFVYISGSRSLDFFVPGSTSQHSDWDFYVPDDSMHVSAFLTDMEEAGVIWQSPLEEIKRLMQGEKTGLVRVCTEAWDSTFGEGVLDQAVIDFGYKIRPGRILNTLLEDPYYSENYPPDDDRGLYDEGFRDSGIVYIKVNCDDKTLEECQDEVTDYFDVASIKLVIRGLLPRENKLEEIQLIVERRNHPLQTDALLDFHSTSVQSYISAHVACHFYGKWTFERKTHVWKRNCKTRKAESSLAKYTARGFTQEKMIKPLKRRFTTRHADDEHATFIAGFDFTGADQGLPEEYEAWARNVMWWETFDKPYRMRSPQHIYSTITRSVRQRIWESTTQHAMARLWGVRDEGERREDYVWKESSSGRRAHQNYIRLGDADVPIDIWAGFDQ